MVEVRVNRKKALVDIGCGRTLVQEAGVWSASKSSSLNAFMGLCDNIPPKGCKKREVLGKTFHCVVGVVPHLDCLELLGRDCPLMPDIPEGTEL